MGRGILIDSRAAAWAGIRCLRPHYALHSFRFQMTPEGRKYRKCGGHLYLGRCVGLMGKKSIKASFTADVSLLSRRQHTVQFMSFEKITKSVSVSVFLLSGGLAADEDLEVQDWSRCSGVVTLALPASFSSFILVFLLLLHFLTHRDSSSSSPPPLLALPLLLLLWCQMQ